MLVYRTVKDKSGKASDLDVLTSDIGNTRVINDKIKLKDKEPNVQVGAAIASGPTSEIDRSYQISKINKCKKK